MRLKDSSFFRPRQKVQHLLLHELTVASSHNSYFNCCYVLSAVGVKNKVVLICFFHSSEDHMRLFENNE